MKYPLSCRKSGGFTIIELLIATAVFSVIILVITAGVIGFSRQYYKGVITSNTQTTTRAIMSEIVQGIQFGNKVQVGLSDASGAEGFCIDDKLYSFIVGQQVSDRGPNASLHQAYHGLVADNNSGNCSSTPVTLSVPTGSNLGAGQRELLGDRMRLSALSIESSDGVTYQVHVRVIYGEDDLLVPSTSITPIAWDKEKCALGAANQYCAVSDLTTTVQKRIVN